MVIGLLAGLVEIIAFLEFYPIVYSLHLWGREITNSRSPFFTDNEALVHVINKQSCHDKMVLVCLSYNICFKVKHIPGFQNKLADSLSCLQLQTFKQLKPPCMHRHPTPIPRHLQPANWEMQLPFCCAPVFNSRAWQIFQQFYNSTFQRPFSVLHISSSVYCN